MQKPHVRVLALVPAFRPARSASPLFLDLAPWPWRFSVAFTDLVAWPVCTKQTSGYCKKLTPVGMSPEAEAHFLPLPGEAFARTFGRFGVQRATHNHVAI